MANVGFPGGSMVKNLPVMQKMWETWVWSMDWEDPLEEEMVTHFNNFARRIPWTDEPGDYSTWDRRVRHDWRDSTHAWLMWYFWGKAPLEVLVNSWLTSSVEDGIILIPRWYGVHGTYLKLLYWNWWSSILETVVSGSL